MTDANTVIENFFLEHGQTKAEISEYNKRYYRENKHRWANVKAEGQARVMDQTTADANKRLREYNRKQADSRSGRDERLAMQERKIRQARSRLGKVKPDKRNAIQRKLDAAEKKIKDAKNKLKGTKGSRTYRDDSDGSSVKVTTHARPFRPDSTTVTRTRVTRR